MVYIIHFDRPYKRARHYTGYSNNVNRRIVEHTNLHQSGSPLIKAALLDGIPIHIAKVFEDGDRALERYLKRQKNIKRFCPLCSGYKKEKPIPRKPKNKSDDNEETICD